MSKEAMTLALEALQWFTAAEPWDEPDVSKAIKALEEARASEQEQRSDSEQLGEPVAWVCYGAVSNDIDFEQDDIDALPVGTMLYTTPQPAQKPLDCFETEKLAKQCGVEWTTRIDKLCNLAAAHGIKEKNNG